MSFYGKTFIFADIPSEFYNLKILDFEETGGKNNSPAGSDIQIMQKWVYRKPKTYHFGNYQNTPLEFTMTVGSIDPISGIDRGRISKWLLGRGSYLPLSICQDDISNVYYNVICTSAENIYVGNVQRGMKLHFTCDSPFAWEFPRNVTYNFSGNEIKNFNFNFYNSSEDSGYLYPIVEFTLNSIGNSMIITNLNDNNRVFSFTGIQPLETITIDNYLQTVTSSTGLLRLSNFNKQWLRLVPNLNVLNVVSGIGILKITYSFARKIGA
jgi:hypothetical protein